MDTLIQDLRYAVRSLLKSPGFTIVAVATLALGIGATTAIFGILNSVLLRPLPYPHADRLASVWEAGSRGGVMGLSRLDLEDWRRETRSFKHLAAYYASSANLTGTGQPARVTVATVTPDFFDVFGSLPLRGHLFRGATSADGVVISNGLWQRLYGGVPEALGRSVAIDGASFPVVGILPPQFDFPHGTDLWAPLDLDQDRTSRSAHNYQVVGDLLPGVDVRNAQADMAGIAARLADEYPNSNHWVGAKIINLQEDLTGNIRPTLMLFSVMVALVLLIASANVAALLLVRATAREREMGVRSALGADTGRLVRQLLTESGLLAATGAGLGLLLAIWVVAALRTAVPIAELSGLPRIIDGTVLAFTIGLAIATALVFGTAPALRGARGDLSDALKRAGGRGVTTLGSHGTLIGGEVALATILLLGAGLTARSLWRLQGETLGFEPHQVTVAGITFPAADSGAAWIAGAAQLIDAVGATPGISSAALASGLPFSRYSNGSFVIEGRPEDVNARPNAAWRAGSSGLFRTLGIPVREGRDFASADRGEPAVAIVNQAAARAYWPDGDPIGARIALPGYDDDTYAASKRGSNEWFTIVGVVGDTRDIALGIAPGPTIYLSLDQRRSDRNLAIAVKSNLPPADLRRSLSGILTSFNPDAPVQLRAMDDLVAQTTASPRLRALLIGLFALLAATLAAIGIYGVSAYATAQRTREIGLRIALGASPRKAVATIVRRIALYAGGGLLLGLAAGVVEARLIGRFLYGIHPADATTFAAVALVLGGVAFAATYLPARRATRIDPMVALRAE
ncbi:MAG: ABC transporter permease [Gemmatimonadales bacterium]